MKRRPNIRRSMMVSSLLVSLLPLLLIALFLLLFIVREKNIEFRGQINGLAQGIRGQIQIFLNQPMAALSTIAVMLDEVQSSHPLRTRRILNANVRSSPYFELITLLDRSGRVVEVGLPENREHERMDLLGNDLFHLPEFQRALASGKPLWSDTFFSLASGELSVMLYIPAGDDFLAAEIGLTRLAQFIKRLCPETVQTMVIDKNGTILVHSEVNELNQGTMANDIALVTAAIQGREEEGLFSSRGMTYFGMTSRIEPVGWVALISKPVDRFFAMLIFPLLIIGMGVAIAMILSLFLAVNRSRKLSLPLMEISAKSKVIAQGEYSYLMPPEEYQEVTELAVSFNEMTSAIKQREERLRESELKYRELVENTSNVVLLIDKNLRISYANHTLLRFVAVADSQMVGMSFQECILQEDWPEVQAVMGDWISRQDESGCFECRSRDAAGTVHFLFFTSNLHYDMEGELRDISMIGHDLTIRHQMENERRELEEKQQRSQKMELLGLMAGGVAHDLNNILAGIINIPEMMLLSLDAQDEKRKSLELIKQSGERAAAVVADLLTIARGSATARTPLDLNLIIESYLASPEFAKLQSSYPLVHFRFLPVRPLWICSCSKTHIEKVLLNLVINAFEAIAGGCMGEDAGAGQVEVMTENIAAAALVQLTSELPSGEYVSFLVRDSGSGISEDDLPRIFEPFFSKKGLGRSGTGIGLSVVWNSIREHGGTVLVASSDAGTSFQILLPVCQEKEDQTRSTGSLETLHGNGQHILVVDDEELIRDVAVNMLEILGYRATTASSGEKAIVYLETHAVDLIILDMQMEPGINGQQTYAIIHERNPRQKALIATGFSYSRDVDAAIEQGAGGLIQKPYNLQDLGRAVHDALHREVSL